MLDSSGKWRPGRRKVHQDFRDKGSLKVRRDRTRKRPRRRSYIIPEWRHYAAVEAASTRRWNQLHKLLQDLDQKIVWEVRRTSRTNVKWCFEVLAAMLRVRNWLSKYFDRERRVMGRNLCVTILNRSAMLRWS